MEKLGTIYKIENLVNGKVYVGQTIQSFKVRIGNHKSALRHNRHKNDHLQRAWNKYGEKNFRFSIIEKCSYDTLDKKETKWIKYFRENTGSYNLESGGNKLKRHSSYSRMKMSKAMRERAKTPEFRKWLKENAKNISGAKNVNARKIICITTGKVFETMSEASIEYNLDVRDIHKVCEGIYKSAGYYKTGIPYQFAYYEEGKIYKEKQIHGLYDRKKIVLTNTGEVFDSATKAAKKYGLSQTAISACCRGETKSAGKLPNGEYSVWVYEEDYNPNKNYFFHRHLGSHNPRAKKVICLTTGEVFETMREAGEVYNISGNGSKISLACTGKRKHVGKLPDGTPLKWAYYDDYIASK